ncbi:serine hydrolase domain-containing protein [Ruminococcus bromii]|uniref:Penicillin-binding protein E n=2 Tax=Ruminococcus bromii TaxID=40518 RepID=A0A2N0UMP2_9FIRM|nr:serine hydrolase domain-containing protein [Ruminococcus bromii]PKD28261.1 Penicillin-binding protein E [Ruminococcus bromii]
MLISSKKILCLAISALTAFSVCFTGCGKDTQSSVSATEKTTAVAASQPVTKAATSDEQKQEPTWNYSELKRKSADISNTLDDIITSNKYRGTVYVKIGNALEYIGTNGFSDKDRHTKNSTDTCFRIASLTKQFTAVAVMQLVEDGKLSLDDTIDKYFPSYKYGKKITVKNLLTMTAGIKDYINKDGDTNTYAYNESQIEFKVSAKNSAKKNKKAVMDWIFNQKLNFEPDEKYMYSNSAYFLLGDIIEQVSKTSYEKYVKEKILKPSGMMSTGFESTDKLAVGYQDIYDNVWTLYPGVGYSATSLISNVPDLLKWVDALCTNKLVSEETFKEMTTPYKDNYGYGFVVSEESNAVSHTGKIDKYNAALVFTKDGNQIYIALSNYSNSSPIALFNNIQKTLAPFYG